MTNSEKRQMNESLLQNYRSNYIASQSLLIATGAIIYGQNRELFVFIAFVGLVQMALWARVIYVRGLVVDFYEHDIFEFCELDEYVKNIGDKRLKIDTYLNHRRYRYDGTRFKVDIFMPITFAVIWLLMVGSCFVG